jgi:hypothetical protein
MNFNEWLQAQGFDPEQLTAAQMKTLKAAYEAEIQASAPPAGNPAPPATPASPAPATTPQPAAVNASGGNDNGGSDYLAQRAADVEYADRIRAICREHEGMTVEHEGAQVSLEAHALSNRWTPDQTELYAMRQSRPAVPAIHAMGGDGAAEHYPQVLEAAISIGQMGLSVDHVAASYPESVREEVMNTATSRAHRNSSLHTVMHETIRAAGMSYRAGVNDDGFVRRTLEANQLIEQRHGDQVQASTSGGFSTISLSGILSNIANKSLAQMFDAVDNVAARISRTRSMNDFKQHTAYRMVGIGRFDKVGPDGELKSIQLDEAPYPNQLQTFGNTVVLTRQMMINDDLSAFGQITSVMGRLAAVALNRTAFELLLSNPTVGANTFFHADNGNLLTGAGSALSIDALSAADQAFMNQTDENGDPIMIQPSIMIVPTTLKQTAANLINESSIIMESRDTAATTAKAIPQRNPHVGQYRMEVTPWLNAQSLTNASDTAWYLIAEPSVVPVVEIGYLNGQSTPVIESAETDLQTLGMGWRAWYDYGCALVEHRGGILNDGA